MLRHEFYWFHLSIACCRHFKGNWRAETVGGQTEATARAHAKDLRVNYCRTEGRHSAICWRTCLQPIKLRISSRKRNLKLNLRYSNGWPWPHMNFMDYFFRIHAACWSWSSIEWRATIDKLIETVKRSWRLCSTAAKWIDRRGKDRSWSGACTNSRSKERYRPIQYIDGSHSCPSATRARSWEKGQKRIGQAGERGTWTKNPNRWTQSQFGRTRRLFQVKNIWNSRT